MYFSLKFFSICVELHVSFFEIFWRLRRATCIFSWNFSAPGAGYLYFFLKFFWRLRRATCIFLKFFGAWDGILVYLLKIFRRLRTATCISSWNFSAPAAGYLYFSLKFFGTCDELHVFFLEFFGACGGILVYLLEIFPRLRPATCISSWNFRRLRQAACIFSWNFSAPAARYLHFFLKCFGTWGGLLLFLLEMFRRLRRAIVVHIKLSSAYYACWRIIESINKCDTILLKNIPGKSLDPPKLGFWTAGGG